MTMARSPLTSWATQLDNSALVVFVRDSGGSPPLWLCVILLKFDIVKNILIGMLFSDRQNTKSFSSSLHSVGDFKMFLSVPHVRRWYTDFYFRSRKYGKLLLPIEWESFIVWETFVSDIVFKFWFDHNYLIRCLRWLQRKSITRISFYIYMYIYSPYREHVRIRVRIDPPHPLES
jgi:hypothetical protein